jgi:hypothetical protein
VEVLLRLWVVVQITVEEAALCAGLGDSYVEYQRWTDPTVTRLIAGGLADAGLLPDEPAGVARPVELQAAQARPKRPPAYRLSAANGGSRAGRPNCGKTFGVRKAVTASIRSLRTVRTSSPKAR